MRLRFGFGLANVDIVSPPLQNPSIRGGSGTDALTNTLDPSLVSGLVTAAILSDRIPLSII